MGIYLFTILEVYSCGQFIGHFCYLSFFLFFFLHKCLSDNKIIIFDTDLIFLSGKVHIILLARPSKKHLRKESILFIKYYVQNSASKCLRTFFPPSIYSSLNLSTGNYSVDLHMYTVDS